MCSGCWHQQKAVFLRIRALGSSYCSFHLLTSCPPRDFISTCSSLVQLTAPDLWASLMAWPCAACQIPTARLDSGHSWPVVSYGHLKRMLERRTTPLAHTDLLSPMNTFNIRQEGPPSHSHPSVSVSQTMRIFPKEVARVQWDGQPKDLHTNMLP